MTTRCETTDRRVRSAAVWALCGRGLGVLANALLIAALPRILSTEQLGAFSLIASWMMIAAVIGTVGLNDGSVRMLSEALALQDRRRLEFILRTGRWLTITIGCVAGAVLAAWLVGFRPAIVELSSATFLFPAIAVGVVLLAVQMVSAESLRGLHDIRLASLLSGGGTGGPVTTLIFVGAVGVLFASGQITLTNVVGVYLAALGVVLPFTLWFLRRARTQTLAALNEIARPATAAWTMRPLLAISIPLMFVHLLVFFTMNADLWIADQYFPLSEVGLYTAARRLMLVVSLPGQVAAQAVMSSIPDLSVRGRLQELETLLRRTALLSAVPAVALGLFLLAAPAWSLAIVCGEEYAAAASALFILCVGNLLAALCGNPIHALIMTGRHYYGLIVYASAAALLAIGGPWAAQQWGIVGVATVASVCLVLQSGASWVLARCFVGVWTHVGWPVAHAAAELPPSYSAEGSVPT